MGSRLTLERPVIFSHWAGGRIHPPRQPTIGLFAVGAILLARSQRQRTSFVIRTIICGWGYAEGGRLSRTLGGWQVISWALVLSLPIMIALAVFYLPPSFAGIGPDAWAGLAYVSLFSMLIGFVFWYRPGAGRDCSRRATPALAAILRPGAGGLAAWRSSDARNARRHLCSDPVRCRCAEVCAIARRIGFRFTQYPHP